ncbi:unnamed protein product [Miscanthus lutarioriparius]|uniref:Transposase-associated domain-containing protein n=1 Tax=Miscanthus lutarioriparius TaxID=422564 RepID=A0A811NIP9_9POAL|nr:unnamed protein product [Miscanthus lutarioriparius]
MDRSWINSRRFSKEHVDGVKEFMTFVSERFNDNEEMFCPCRRCLNRVRKPQGQVQDDLYIHGMASTYTRWIHHGEPLEVILHENEDHVDEQTSLNEDFGMNVDKEDDPDDGIRDMVEELYTAEDEGKLRELVGTKPVVAAREESDPLYEPREDTEPGDSDIEQGVVDKSHFSIDPSNKKAVEYACVDLLKKEQRNMRYLLKKKYFNGIPANQVRTTSPLGTMTDEQWKALVDMWSTPKHKEKCLKAKDTRGLVKHQQKTGSRSYIAQCYVTKSKFKDDPPTAIDFFKATHFSSKTGYSEDAQEAIAEMEAIAAQAPEEGQVVKTPTQVVAQVLPTSKFLQNISIESAAMKRSAEVATRVQELESELVVEKEGAAEVRV